MKITPYMIGYSDGYKGKPLKKDKYREKLHLTAYVHGHRNGARARQKENN